MDAVKYFILFLNVYIQIVYVEIFAAIYDIKWVLYVYSSVKQAFTWYFESNRARIISICKMISWVAHMVVQVASNKKL